MDSDYPVRLLCVLSAVALTFAQGCLVSFDRDFDFDNDTFAGETDCGDENAAINPSASEVCGDGIDQDCDGVDVACPEDDEARDAATSTPDASDDDDSGGKGNANGNANGHGNGNGNANGNGNGNANGSDK